MHWNNLLRSSQEIFNSVSCLSWSHTKAVSNWKHSNSRFIKFINQFHVGEYVGVTGVVNNYIVVWDSHYKTASISSGNLHTLWSYTGRWMLGVNHCNFAESEIFCSTSLHFCNKLRWNFSEEFVISSNF